MENEEMDIIELETEDGGTIKLNVERYFYYNGDEFVLLSEIEHAENEEPARYVMKVEQLPDEEGEEMEEFVPVEPELEEQLISVVQNTFNDEDEEDDDAQ